MILSNLSWAPDPDVHLTAEHLLDQQTPSSLPNLPLCHWWTALFSPSSPSQKQEKFGLSPPSRLYRFTKPSNSLYIFLSIILCPKHFIPTVLVQLLFSLCLVYCNCLRTGIPASGPVLFQSTLRIAAEYCYKSPSVIILFLLFNIFYKYIRPFASLSRTKGYSRLHWYRNTLMASHQLGKPCSPYSPFPDKVLLFMSQFTFHHCSLEALSQPFSMVTEVPLLKHSIVLGNCLVSL